MGLQNFFKGGKFMKKLTFKMHVHTCQLLTKKGEPLLKEINKHNCVITPKARVVEKGTLIPINPNKYDNTNKLSLSEFKTAVHSIKKELGINNGRFNRIDVAFDTEISYPEIRKILLCIAHLVAVKKEIENAIESRSVETEEVRAILVRKQGKNAFELQIYDKKLESKAKQPYSRVEFRYKNISEKHNLYTVLQELGKLLGCLVDSFEKMEQRKISRMCTLWESEKRQHPNISFSDFVFKYEYHFLTRNILKSVYETALKGNFDNWLKSFRKSKCDIELVCKEDIKAIIKEMRRALRAYKNGAFSP